jgi:predicted dinucleotide-binding enzyme
MVMSNQYAIVGSGNVGTALARLFSRANIDVSIANTRGPDSLRTLTAELGPRVHAVAVEEALDSEIIFMAIPWSGVSTFGKLLDDWSGRIVVDTSNAHWAPGWEEIVQGRPSSEYNATQLPGASLVKGFNQLPAGVLSSELDPRIGRRVVFLATDVPEAGDRIARLAADLGFSPVQLGRFDEGGLLIQTPHALVLRSFVERPFR